MQKMTIPPRLRLFLPVSLIITVVVVFLTVWFVKTSVKNFNLQLENHLILEVKTLGYMFERESNLKLQTVENNLNVVSAVFKDMNPEYHTDTLSVQVENQETGHRQLLHLNNWLLNGKPLMGDSVFVDSLQQLLGGTITIFQKTETGFVRMSTNVRKNDGSRATETYIPFTSPVARAVSNGQRFTGRAFVVDDWYVTAYEPIFHDSEIIGMLYVGDKEKDLHELEKNLNSLRIGESGYPFVFDNSGVLIIHPERKGENWGDSLLFQQVVNQNNGILHYQYAGRKKTMAFTFYEPFELYIAAAVFSDEETAYLKKDATVGAVITAIIAIIFLLGFLYYFTTERLYKFLLQLQQSRKKLQTISKALEESEERFRKLFDSTGDDIFVTDMDENIVEVNAAVCETLGYSREELLSMKITEVKSPKFRDSVSENRKLIYEKGSHQFESEHVTKSGQLVHVEFTSRLVSYENEQLILSVVRNISERRELERKILSAVIQGEEKERSRFAREMHDGLGPLLSTIKLYVNELGSSGIHEDERKDLIRHSNELIDEAVNSARTISNNLMPTVIHSYGLVNAVQAFCEKVNKTNQLNIRFETENIHQRLDQNLELILFRVISELINNTLKHAEAKYVNILLVQYEDRLSLYFKDDGVGFVVEDIIQSENKGMGLKNIISRVKSINGNYHFLSRPGEGFTIRIEINL
jgi:PAS domain S-box-containing protein